MGGECTCDVAIAGGGPAGMTLALKLASRGIDAHVFEEHPAIGSPAHCAGLVGPDIVEVEDVGPLVERCTLNRLKGATFVSPGGRSFDVTGAPGSALVIDRKALDRRLGEAAAKNGATIHLRSHVDSVGGGKLRSEGLTFRPRVTVGATGSRFAVASALGERTGTVVPGVQYEVANLSLDQEMARIYLGRGVSRGLFGWLIPLDSTTARIGVCSRTGAKRRLNALMEVVREDFGAGRTVEVNAGAVVYGLRPKTVFDSVLLLGDEALQTKPTTGGGIHYSMICAGIASQCIVDHIQAGASLAQYEGRWRKELEGEIKWGLMARRAYDSLSDDEIDGLFSLASEEIIDRLSDAEFDRHSSLAPLLAHTLPMVIKELGLRRSLSLLRPLLSGNEYL